MRIAIEYVEDQAGSERSLFVLDSKRIQKFDAQGKFLQVASEFKGTPALYGISISGSGEEARLHVVERDRNCVMGYSGTWDEDYERPEH